MLIYIILMAAVTAFLYTESQKIPAGRSELLKDFCKDPVSTKTILSLMRKVCLASAVSAICMMLCYIDLKITGVLLKPVAALSILVYSAGMIWAMFKLKDL